jgi:hypothetical protein
MAETDRYQELLRREARGEMIPKQQQLYLYYYESVRLGIPDEKIARVIPERWLERDEKRRGGCCNILPFEKPHTKRIT